MNLEKTLLNHEKKMDMWNIILERPAGELFAVASRGTGWWDS